MKRLPILPAINCGDSCGECCTIVPITETEMGRIERYAAEHGLKPLPLEIPRCPWYQNGGCAVYEVRPLLCRLYGHAPKLTCKHHPEHAGDLPNAKLDALMRGNGPAKHFVQGRVGPAEFQRVLLAMKRRLIEEGDDSGR